MSPAAPVELLLVVLAMSHIRKLSDEELCALNIALCAGHDPRDALGYEKVQGLFKDPNAQGVPQASPETKRAFHLAVLQRFPPPENP